MCVFIYMVIARRPCGPCSYIYRRFQTSTDRNPSPLYSTLGRFVHFFSRRFTAQPDLESLWSTCFCSFLILLKLQETPVTENATCNLQTVCWHLLPAYEEHDRWVRESYLDTEHSHLGLVFSLFYFMLKNIHFLSGVLYGTQGHWGWFSVFWYTLCVINGFRIAVTVRFLSPRFEEERHGGHSPWAEQTGRSGPQ